MGLRHAGSPAGTPEKLTRAKQDAILLVSVMACRAELRRKMSPLPDVREQNIASFRAALRLDDYHLNNLVAAGFYRQPWRSPTDRERSRAR